MGVTENSQGNKRSYVIQFRSESGNWIIFAEGEDFAEMVKVFDSISEASKMVVREIRFAELVTSVRVLDPTKPQPIYREKFTSGGILPPVYRGTTGDGGIMLCGDRGENSESQDQR